MGNTIEEQIRQVLTNPQSILEIAGASLSDVVKTMVFLADVTEFSRINTEYVKFFPQNPLHSINCWRDVPKRMNEHRIRLINSQVDTLRK